jgi:hypothetical protein
MKHVGWLELEIKPYFSNHETLYIIGWVVGKCEDHKLNKIFFSTAIEGDKR